MTVNDFIVILIVSGVIFTILVGYALSRLPAEEQEVANKPSGEYDDPLFFLGYEAACKDILTMLEKIREEQAEKGTGEEELLLARMQEEVNNVLIH